MSPARFQWKIIVPVAVLLAAAVLVWWVLIGPFRWPGNSSQPAPTNEIAATETPLPSEWATLAAGAEPSSVALQTFQGGRIIRSGTGTVVSSDGLIVTVNDVVPFTSPSATYQMVAQGRVHRAVVVRRDHVRNLALVKADVSDLTIAHLTDTRPLMGSPLAVVGGFVNVSAYSPYFVHAWVSYKTDPYVVLDAAFAPILAGGRVLTPDGRQVGMVFLRSEQVRMVRSEDIRMFVEEYLQAQSAE